MIILVAELQDIKCIPDGKARAVIIESKVDKAMGPLGTVIVKDGILKQEMILLQELPMVE